MSLREVGKSRRRGRILKAARECIQVGGAERLSLKAIAKSAEVSVATLYNLFGSKEGILVALLLLSIESFRQRQERSSSSDQAQASLPMGSRGQLDSLTDIAIDEFVSDEYFYRELLKSLHQMEAQVHLNGLVGICLDLGEPIIRSMIAAKELAEVVSPRVISHQIFMAFVHAVQLWSSGVTTSAQFRAQVAHSQCLLLAGVATDSFRKQLHERLRALDGEMLDFSRQQPIESNAFTFGATPPDAPTVKGATA